MTEPVDLSIVIPVFNEVDSLPILWDELKSALEALGLRTEVIFVDDGSTDGSASVLRGIVRGAPSVRLRRLARNSGLSAAFHAGFQVARGRIIVTMDSDLQTRPGDIGQLLAQLDGFDVVSGWRRTRRDPWLKRVSSHIANAIRNRVTADTVKDSASSFRAMRRECVAAIPPYHGMHRFVPTLLRLAGYRVVEIPIDHYPRRFGHSKYGVRNRARRAFEDLLAVRWMMARRLHYAADEEDGPGLP